MFLNWFHPDNIYPLHYTFYTWTGFYKIDSKSPWKRSLYDLYHILMEICYIFTTLALMAGAYMVRNNIGKLSSNLCVTICLFGQLNKIWFLHYYRKESDKLRDKFDNNLNVSHVGKSVADREIFKKYSRESAKATLLLYGLSIPLLVFWITFPMIDSGKGRRFPVEWPPLPGIKISPGYEVMYAYISLELVQFCTNIMSYDLIFYGYLIRISAHFEILAKNIRKISNLYSKNDGYRENEEENDSFENNYQFGKTFRAGQTHYGAFSGNSTMDSTRSKNVEEWKFVETMRMMKMNVVHHKAILKTLEEIGSIYQGPIIFHVSCGAAMIGVLAYGIIAESESLNSQLLQRFLFVSGTMFDLYIYCHYGSQITQQSYQTAEALYDIPWYEMEKAPRKLIAITMAKLRKPPEISGAKIFPINLPNYLEVIIANKAQRFSQRLEIVHFYTRDILKIAYNMIAVLRQARHHNQEYD